MIACFDAPTSNVAKLFTHVSLRKRRASGPRTATVAVGLRWLWMPHVSFHDMISSRQPLYSHAFRIPGATHSMYIPTRGSYGAYGVWTNVFSGSTDNTISCSR